jgi:hypothetical protein
MRHRHLLALILVVASSRPLYAGFAAKECYLPSVGTGTGSGTSFWFTTVWVHNPTPAAVNVRFELLERGRSNVTPAAVYNDSIPAGDTRRYANALETIFGIRDRRFGAIRVVASDRVVVNGRIFSKEQSGPERDSVGQFFAAVPASFAIGGGESTTVLGVYQSTPLTDSEYRYNFGFVETSGSGVRVKVTAIDESGAEVASKEYALAAYEAQQYGITDLVPGVSATNLRLQVSAVAGSAGKIVAFGSGLANRSNDPSTFEMSFKDSLLAESGGSSFTLPYSGSGSSPSTLFRISNAGAGGAIDGLVSGAVPAVYGTSTGSGGVGVRGEANSGARAYGLFGTSQQGVGVRAESTQNNAIEAVSTTLKGVAGYGWIAGVYGQAGDASTKAPLGGERVGVWGDVAIGYGVFGAATTGSAVVGHVANGTAIAAWAQEGTAVNANNTSTSGRQYGVYARSASPKGVAIYAESSEASSKADDAYAGYFVAKGAEDVGVWAASAWPEGGGQGGHFESAATHGTGVTGAASTTSGDAVGVIGRTAARDGSGVSGKNTATGTEGSLGTRDFGVYAKGDAHVDGKLTWKPVKGYVSVAPAGFQPWKPKGHVFNFVNFGCTLSWDGPENCLEREFFFAPVQLPHGATITRLGFRMFSAYDLLAWAPPPGSGCVAPMEVTLYRVEVGGPSNEGQVAVVYNGVVPKQTIQAFWTSTVALPLVQNDVYAYYVSVAMQSYWNGVEFRGAFIEYEISGP